MNTDKIETKIVGNEPWLDTSSLDKRMVVVEFAKSSSVNFCGAMTELERKFIIMSRISVALWRKGIASCVNMHQDGFCAITVMLGSYKSESFNHDFVTSYEATEAELLEWWAEVER